MSNALCPIVLPTLWHSNHNEQMTIFQSQDALLHQLRQGKNEAFERLYREHYPKTAAFVRKNSGSEADARDIFQEALLVFLRKIRAETFELSSDVGGFMFGISKNLWLYRLRSHKSDLKTETAVASLAPVQFADDQSLPPDLENAFEAKYEVVQNLLETLKNDCRELLEGFYFRRQTLQQLGEALGFAEGYAKLKKHRCMDLLREKAVRRFAELGLGD